LVLAFYGSKHDFSKGLLKSHIKHVFFDFFGQISFQTFVISGREKRKRKNFLLYIHYKGGPLPKTDEIFFSRAEKLATSLFFYGESEKIGP
jgi:hypothetical protein